MDSNGLGWGPSPQQASPTHPAPADPARPPFPRHITQGSLRSATSQDSVFSGPRSSPSTQTDASAEPLAPGVPGRREASATSKRTLLVGDTVVSSPLSSPPPVLFDPYETISPSLPASSRSSSEGSEASDTEDTQPSLDVLAHAANPSLRHMKGRDLFDANIWADPLKTSVFYRFATSLRQRVREVQPTPTHHFLAQLRDVGKLARVYTQNIDEIEKKIGLSTDLRSGAGNKRRKSAKPPPLTAPEDVPEEKETDKENPDSLKREEEATRPETVEAAPLASQASEDIDRGKPRLVGSPDKGVECVFLHGSLHSLRCFVCGKLCDWDEDDRESRTLSGEQPECPHCAGATAARQEKGKRALGVGKLRPDIVLYGEDHPQSDLISPIVQYDLSAGPDLLLVLGTSLRVHGLKVLIKEFAKAVHQKGGKVVFINLTKPSDSVWGDVIDYWIAWDCDAWVTDLKDRKPHLWLSPEVLQAQEKQKRESLAEKRRGPLGKRDSLLGETRRQTIATSQPRAPPKNPSAMRNDYACGAYVVYDIFQALAKIGDRPFDHLGYGPPPTIRTVPPPSSLSSPALPSPAPPKPDETPIQAPAVKGKRSGKRKSAPALLHARGGPPSKRQPAVKARYKFTTCTPIPPPVIPLLQSRPRPPAPLPPTSQPSAPPQRPRSVAPPPAPRQPSPRPPSPSPPPAAPVRSPTPPPDPSASIGAAVKTHPRRRKPKAIFEGAMVRPAPKPRRAAAPPTASSLPAPLPAAPDPRADVAAAHPLPAPGPAAPPEGSGYCTPQEGGITLAPLLPLVPGPTPDTTSTTPPMPCLEPNPIVSPPSPLAYAVPGAAPRPPLPVRAFPYPYPSHPMLYSDPLGRLPYGAGAGMRSGSGSDVLAVGQKIGPAPGRRSDPKPPHRPGAGRPKDVTPSPSDQLQREHWEAATSLMSLGVTPS